ncbi:MAG: hypothetical protein K8T89_08875 [Planctomycetes bacterium]|nr:hypothetical protein [Planctomycetota bacterium]
MRLIFGFFVVLSVGLSAQQVHAGEPQPISQWNEIQNPAPPRKPKSQMSHREKIEFHQAAPDGIPFPVGSGNAWTEFKYVFGSSRQFYGTAESTEGHLRRTYIPAPRR